MIITLCLFTQAQAGYFYFNPTGQTPAVQNSTLSIDLMFNPESDNVDLIEGYAFRFEFDTTELAFTSASNNLSGFLPIIDHQSNVVNISGLSLGTPFSFQDYIATSVASFNFLVTSEKPFDGFADVILLSQIGTSGVHLQGFTDNFGFTHQYLGASGTDVGVATVPAPGAIWLLGTGSILLEVVRRRRSNY